MAVAENQHHGSDRRSQYPSGSLPVFETSINTMLVLGAEHPFALCKFANTEQTDPDSRN